MQRVWWQRMGVTLTALSIIGLSGCESTQSQTQAKSTAGTGTQASTQPATTAQPATRRSGFFGVGFYRPQLAAGQTASSQAFPTGDESTSALLVHQVMPREVRLGQPYNYEIHVTNLTDSTLSNVVVTTSSLNNLAIESSQPVSSRSADGGAQWAFPSLAARQTEVIRVVGRAASRGSSGSCLSVSYNNFLCATTNVVEPALVLTKTATPEATPCDPITLTYTVKNTGSGAAEAVRVRDTLPAGLTVDGQQTIDREVGNLAAGQERTISVRARATQTGTLGSAASATSAGGLTAASQPASTVIRQPVLALTAECSGQSLIGRLITVRYTIRNTGNGPSNATVLTAPVPANTRFESADNRGAASGGNVRWDLGAIPAGESRTVTMNVRSTGAGQIAAQGTVQGACANPATANCTLSVQGVPDIGTGIEDDTGVVLVGDTHTFRFVVKNQGQIPLTGVKVVGVLSDGLDFVSTTWTTPPRVEGRTITIDIGSLAAGQSRNFNIVVRGTKAGEQEIETTTSVNELRNTVRNDEQVNFIDR